MTQKLKIISGKVENVMGKGINAGYKHFLPRKLSKAFLLMVVKRWEKVAKY